MNMSNRRQLFSWLILSVLLSGCHSKSTTNNSTVTNANEETKLPKAEVVTLEKITGAESPNASELIASYNSRNSGSPGWRRVSMELFTDGALTRAFTVVNIWHVEKDRAHMLFLLEEPKGLTGTNYLLQEQGDKPPEMEVHLFLPAGERRVLAVDPGNFDEGLLGSDFTYNDVRMRLPVQDFRYRVVGKSVLRNEPVWVLEAEPTSELTRRSRLWKHANFYLARNFQFLLGVDYFSGSADEQSSAPLLKPMRVESFKQINGAWTATKMLMFGSEGRSTALTLKDAQFGVANIDSSLFTVEKLPSLADKIRQGWVPEDIQRSAAGTSGK